MAKVLLALSSGEVVGKVFTLLTLVLAARAVGVDGFGVLTFGMGLGALLSMIPELAPSARMIQLIGNDRDTLGVRLAALTLLRWLFTVPALTLAIPFILTRSESGDRWALGLMVVASLLDLTMKVWLAACTVLDRQSVTAVVYMGQRLLTLALVIVALVVHPTPSAVAAAFAISALAANAALAKIARGYGARADFRAVGREHLRELLVSIPVYGASSIFETTLARIDVILIGIIAGDAAVGLYGVAYRLLDTVLFVSWSLSRALVPDLVRASGAAELTRTVRIGLVLVCALYLPYGMVLAVAGDRILALLFGSGYQTGLILVFLSAAPLAFGIAHFSKVSLFARKPDSRVPLAVGLALVVNVVLNLILLPHMHAEGAAIAKTAALAVQAFAVGIALHRLAPRTRVLQGVVVAAIATAISACVLLLPIPLILSLILSGVVYVVLWYLLVIRFDDVTAHWVARARGRAQAGADAQGAGGADEEIHQG